MELAVAHLQVALRPLCPDRNGGEGRTGVPGEKPPEAIIVNNSEN